MGWRTGEMFKIAGVILCISGSAGYGLIKITGWNRAIREFEQWILLFERMKSYICYRRDNVIDILCKMDEEIFGIGGMYVSAIGRNLRDNRSCELLQAWQEGMKEWKKDSFLPEKVQKILLHFPEYVGEQDCEQQINNLDFYLHRLRTEKEMLERETYNKKKPVMAISLLGGITVSVLLL